jgi:glutaredoxin
MPRQGLIVYVDPEQDESKRVLQLLRSERCHFITRDVTQSGMAEMELTAIFGRVATPVVVWEGHTVHGYDEEALHSLFERQSS